MCHTRSTAEPRTTFPSPTVEGYFRLRLRPREAFCGGISWSFLEPLGRSWSHFVGICCQRVTRSLENRLLKYPHEGPGVATKTQMIPPQAVRAMIRATPSKLLYKVCPSFFTNTVQVALQSLSVSDSQRGMLNANTSAQAVRAMIRAMPSKLLDKFVRQLGACKTTPSQREKATAERIWRA